jgi:uncharacterized protein YacL (UPF0231 family)
MSNKRDTNSSGGKEEKVNRKLTCTIDHSIVARWVQEQILSDIPELGYLSESLIERILKTAHKYYIQQGFTSIKLSEK